MPAVTDIVKKTDYCTEKDNLLREQYKNKPVINGILEHFGDQAQEIEDALFQIKGLDEGFGVQENFSRDSLMRTAEMFGISYPNLISNEDIVFEVRAAITVMFSRCRIEDVRRLPLYIYGLKSDIWETGEGIYLAIFGSLTEKNTTLLFKNAQKLMPAGTKLFGVVQNSDGWFGTEGFTNSSGPRLSTDPVNDAHRMAQVVMDRNGNWLL